jgi:hypothetical protein
VLKSYLVTSPFSAIQLYREPRRDERFSIGDRLVVLRKAGDTIEFCRQDRPTDVGGKLEYRILEYELLKVAEEL